MLDLPSQLMNRLRVTLLSCGPFDSSQALRAVFIDQRISQWRSRLPESGNPAGRAEGIIDYLGGKQNRNGESALVQFLHVLHERTEPGDKCQQELLVLAGEVEAEYQRDLVALKRELEETLAHDSGREPVRAILDRFHAFHEELYEWKELHDQLDMLLNAFGQFATPIEHAYATRQFLAPLVLKNMWRAVTRQVAFLLGFAEGIELIGLAYQELPGGERVGEAWAVKIASLRVGMDAHLQDAPNAPGTTALKRVLSKWGRQDEAWWQQLYELTHEMSDLIKTQMTIADKNLRETATSLYDLSKDVLKSTR